MVKKRVIQIIVLVVAITGLLAAAWPVYAADVSDALYIADVVAANSDEAATDVRVAVDINTQALINGKYVTEDLLNTAIQTAGGGDVPYMPGVGSNPWIYWLPNIGAYESKPYMFYCGGPAMQTGFYYFPDDGGMTADDAASLELGDTFQIEQRGYVDTSAGDGKYLVSKEEASAVYISGEEEITAGVATSTSGYSSSSDGGIYATSAVYATAQAAATGTVGDSSATFNIGQSLSSFPTVEATNGGNTGQGTSHVISMPSGIVAGDLLLVLFSSSPVTNHTTPSGWTLLFTLQAAQERFSCYYKVAAGGDSVTITTSGSVWASHITYRITGYIGVPECGTATTASSANPDPPALSPSWGSKNTLWFAVTGYRKSLCDETVTVYPANYGSGLNEHQTESGIGSAQRNLTAVSDDPGTFTLSDSSLWVANTIAVCGSFYKVDRGFVYFDTSPIPDGAEIASATLYLYGETDEADTDFELTITNGQPTYPTDPLASGDFDKTHYSGSGGTLSTSGFSTSGYNAITLSETGLEWINLEGTTKLCIRSSRDIDETAPTGDEYVVVYASEEAGTDKDPFLEVVYWDPLVTATGISSGLRRIVIGADGTDFSLEVYDEDDDLIDSDTTPLGGASVPDNDNGWSFVTNGSMSYMEYHKIWVGGTLKQHIVYERDTTFQDQTAYDNDATPTFITATSDPDVTAVFENLRPRTEAEYTGGLGGEYPELLTDIPEPPPEMYGEEGEGLSHIPGAEMVEVILEQGDIPADFFWIWFCYGAAAILVLLGYRFIRSSLLFPVIIGFVVILGFSLASGGDPVPLWTIIPYGTISAGFIVSERVFGW